jgi:hypothetical protein
MLAERVEKDVREHPVATVNRRLAAGVFFFMGQRWFENGQLADRIEDDVQKELQKEAAAKAAEGDENEKVVIDATRQKNLDWLYSAYPMALSTTLLLMLLLGALGWRWTYAWRTWAMPSSLAVMWIPIAYIFSHAEFLSGPRLPLDGVLLCYAAFAVGCFIPGLSPRLMAGPRPVVRERETLRR